MQSNSSPFRLTKNSRSGENSINPESSTKHRTTGEELSGDEIILRKNVDTDDELIDSLICTASKNDLSDTRTNPIIVSTPQMFDEHVQEEEVVLKPVQIPKKELNKSGNSSSLSIS